MALLLSAFIGTACIRTMQLTDCLDRLCGSAYVALSVSRLLLSPLFELFLLKMLRGPYLELQTGLSGGYPSAGLTAISLAGVFHDSCGNRPSDIPYRSPLHLAGGYGIIYT